MTGNEIPIDPRAFQKLYIKNTNKSSVPDRKFHAIRHTFATVLWNSMLTLKQSVIF